MDLEIGVAHINFLAKISKLRVGEGQIMVSWSVEAQLKLTINSTGVKQELREDPELDTMTVAVFKLLPWPQILMKSKNFNAYQIENCQEIILGSEIYAKAHF